MIGLAFEVSFKTTFSHTRLYWKNRADLNRVVIFLYEERAFITPAGSEFRNLLKSSQKSLKRLPQHFT